ncbi:MAG: excinuclease ABC subunit UvrB [Flavobacteriales bacterium]|nr:excinuclease ABC subunit UvrB [Flavobacteriales bacterium]
MAIPFKIHSEFKPTGDQPQAIEQLSEGVLDGEKYQVLLGVTGSGKTFTMANVIERVQKPTLILSHNKTLAAQLYGEFKNFFPENRVEYFVSYYDYYQPEAFLPTTNTYIEKDLSINEEIEKLRLSTTSALLSGRRDVIVVSSVSCIYGIGNPAEFYKNVINLKKGQLIPRNKVLHYLVTSLYSRNDLEFQRGTFRVKGDTLDIYLAYADQGVRLSFFGDEIEEINLFDPETGKTITELEDINIYPANLFVSSKQTQQAAIRQIQDDLVKQVDYFKEIGRHLEAKRLDERVNYDLEMIRELGYCSGIENYSRYFDQRQAGDRPFCLIDYFPDDFLFIMDESHVTNSQISAMYGGDRSRKVNLVDFGFRLPAALDNRPLKYEEFESLVNQMIFVSATPGDFELQKSEGVFVEQVIRPTGLLDPVIEVRPSEDQIDDLLDEINKRIKREERVLVTTLTKRMAEELHKYVERLGIRSAYIHSDVDTLDRIEILRNLRLGIFDVLVGVNLLREGLDLPEVSLVAILDADKEGFLRSQRSLVQTVGRAARNINGRVIMYADKMTDSMQRTIDDTNRRRSIQQAYNDEHGIIPKQIIKSKEAIMGQTQVVGGEYTEPESYQEKAALGLAADPVVQYMTKEQMEKNIADVKRRMENAAKELDFMEAARLRDEMFALKELLKTK